MKHKTIAQQLNITEFPFRIRDKNGNQIYFEDSYGYWYKWEYDSNGNKIHFESSTGCWWKYKYDPNGNLIYFEDWGYEDNRPKPCENKVVEIDGIKYKLTAV
jgi:YD repeat-containing protein